MKAVFGAILMLFLGVGCSQPRMESSMESFLRNYAAFNKEHRPVVFFQCEPLNSEQDYKRVWEQCRRADSYLGANAGLWLDARKWTGPKSRDGIIYKYSGTGVGGGVLIYARIGEGKLYELTGDDIIYGTAIRDSFDWPYSVSGKPEGIQPPSSK